MKLGFTFDEKILEKMNYFDVISKAKNLNISSIELSPDKNILPLNLYYDISKYCKESNIDINFHVPYFADTFLYEINNFIEYKKEIIKKYEEFLTVVENIQNKVCNIPIIVIHGAQYDTIENQRKGFHNTLSFLDWLLNFIERKNISIKLAFETLNKGKSRVIGDIREDVFLIIKEFNNSKLGICWDISHDSTNYYPGKVPFNDEFYNHIIYCHIHGVNTAKSTSHISLQNSTIDFSEIIKYLKEKKFPGILNLELLMSCCGQNYLNALFEDIRYLKDIIE